MATQTRQERPQSAQTWTVRLGGLREGQAFLTALTGLLGYVMSQSRDKRAPERARNAVRVQFATGEKLLHSDVLVLIPRLKP